MKRIILLIWLFSALFLAGCCTAHEHAATKWEYQTVVDSDASAENLTRLGQQGWTVVSFNPYASADGNRHVICLLKRPVK